MTSRTLSAAKITRTAMQLIADGVPISFTNISKQLGTHSQALYNYFADVRALKAAIAATYSNDLSALLQQHLLGLSGQTAVIRFAVETRQYALQHFALTQFILSIPREQLNAQQQVNGSWALRNILNQLLDTMPLSPQQHLNASRMIRNLIIGEVINVGSGWFKSDTVEETDSFERMLHVALAHLAEL